MKPGYLTALFSLLAISIVASCGSSPDGSCYTDFDCDIDQVCGLNDMCLLCSNCERGQVATCTAPVWPRPGPPDSIRIEPFNDREKLIYVYSCSGATSEYRYHRVNGERCFETTAHVDDGCNFEQ